MARARPEPLATVRHPGPRFHAFGPDGVGRVGQVDPVESHEASDVGEFIPHEEASSEAVLQAPLAVARSVD